MITDLIAENYQSLRNVRLRLGRFTVITGPSSSGKSSLFRAAQHIAFNTRGTGYITRGQSKCVVGIGCQEEGWAASIVRGQRGSDSYRIAAADPDGGDEPKTWDYTKLSGKVPDQAAQVVNLREINFAGQFDAPYLLKESAGEVARILGQLTNVTLIFRASQEAARRKKGLAADLRAAEAEVSRLQQEAARFAGLRERMAAVQRAEEALLQLGASQARAVALRAALGRLSSAQAVLNQASQAIPSPPDLGPLEALLQRRSRLQKLLAGHQSAMQSQGHAVGAIAAAQAAVVVVEEQISRELGAAGICPLCGQEVHR